MKRIYVPVELPDRTVAVDFLDHLVTVTMRHDPDRNVIRIETQAMEESIDSSWKTQEFEVPIIRKEDGV